MSKFSVYEILNRKRRGAPLEPREIEIFIDRYTRELIDKLEQVAGDALKARRPGTLAWSQGSVAFAKNRRTAGGPVDQALPVLRADVGGRLRVGVAEVFLHPRHVVGGPGREPRLRRDSDGFPVKR